MCSHNLIAVSFLLEKHDNFKYPFRRKVDSTSIKDIHDGSVFKLLMDETGPLVTPDGVGLILSSDGVPVFKSSKGSLWPVYLMVTNISPQDRVKMDNLRPRLHRNGLVKTQPISNPLFPYSFPFTRKRVSFLTTPSHRFQNTWKIWRAVCVKNKRGVV